MSSTSNFTLRKFEEKDIVFGDMVQNIRDIENYNMDLIDEYLAKVNVVSVSANYTVSATDQFVYAGAGTPNIILPDSVSIGKVFMIGNNTSSSITLSAETLNINAGTVVVGPNYQMKTVVRISGKYSAY